MRLTTASCGCSYLRRFLLFLPLLTCALGMLAPAALGYSFGDPYVRAAGPEQTVFDWSNDNCEENDIPDVPARAFRDYAGNVQLLASHATTRRMIGPDFDHLTHSCTPVMVSDADPDPSHYNDREWIASTYTADGRTVYALVHMEYQGWKYPGCPYSVNSNADHLKCWYNALTFAKSTDGGASYTETAPPSNLVASIPYQYTPGAGPEGIFGASNIIYRPSDAYYYSLIWDVEPGATQRGMCVMRTKTLDQPSSWRAWDGNDFTVRFINPYVETTEPTSLHTCRRIPQEDIGIQPKSLTYSTYLGKYVLVGGSVIDFAVPGIYYSTSDDLIHWSPRRLLMTGEMPWTFKCGDDSPIRDSSLVDPASTSRNFDTVGQRAYLYFTRFNYEYWGDQCWQTLDRDLVRIPIEFQPAAVPPPSPQPPSQSPPVPATAPPAAPSSSVASQPALRCAVLRQRRARITRAMRRVRRKLAHAHSKRAKARYRKELRQLARRLDKASCSALRSP
jgi:hypothetical protein